MGSNVQIRPRRPKLEAIQVLNHTISENLYSNCPKSQKFTTLCYPYLAVSHPFHENLMFSHIWSILYHFTDYFFSIGQQTTKQGL